jgi:hypothetical protein
MSRPAPFDWKDIDAGVRDVVRFLRAHGFETYGSCDGVKRTEFSDDVPNVLLMPGKGESLEQTRVRVVRSLLSAGYRDFSSHTDQCHGDTGRDGISGGFPSAVRLEFYDDLPIRPYACRQRNERPST